MNPRKEIFNNMASTWDKTIIFSDEQKKTIKKVIRKSCIKQNDDILDVGCGTGILVNYILKKINKNGKLTLIDVSDKMIDEAKNKFNDERLTFICADIYDHIFTKKFDKIFVFSAFPHLHDKGKALEIFYELLKYQGKLIIFHVESSKAINTLHKEKVHNEILKKDYLPNIDEFKGIIDNKKWKEISLIDRHALYLIMLEKFNM
jgi:demethylmenaquinone methyltransferase/2-methoxy-6-polyprenyl-1,4-benzoquinol methylase